MLLDRHKERQKHSEWLTGVIASTVANWSMGAPKEPMQPKDFPLMALQDVKPKRTRINRKKIADEIRANFANAMKRQSKS